MQSISDKDWIACDNSKSSSNYGHCYVESDDGNSGLIRMNVSTDGGVTWGDGPMSLGWLAHTTKGSMLGDYIASVFVAERPVPVYAIANPNAGSEFNEAIYVPKAATLSPQLVAAHRSSKADRPLLGIKSDHGPRRVRPLFDVLLDNSP
ncbi:MAG: hypothetical protein ACXVAG_05295 [Vulcanimicrobiaceae bacterium]